MPGLGDVVSRSWFWPALVVIVGLPVVLLVLGELHTWMVRRNLSGTRMVLLIRNVLAPLGAVLVLFTQIPQTGAANGFTWTKVAATAFGFVVILVLLNGLNLAIFVTAREGTWRNRIPAIFVEIARVLLIVISLAVLFGWIWGADIGGFFTAIGVGSIVIGLALQNAVGALLSGLFLIFEQPFQQGDYLVTPNGKGRVVVVNWRATHLDTANGILIIPNATLASETFENLTRSTSPYEASTQVRFSTDDPPQEVIDVMVAVAQDLPQLAPGTTPYAIPVLGRAKYEINIPLVAPGKQYMTLGLFRTRLWYAARRAGLHLNEDLTDNYATPENTREVLKHVASHFSIPPEEIDRVADVVRLERYGEGETVQRAGTVPNGIRVIVSGAVQLSVPGEQGALIPVTQLKRDDMLGLTALTRQAVATTGIALVDLAVLFLPVRLLDVLVKTRPDLARDIGTAMDHRQQLGAKALEAAGVKAEPDSFVIS